MFIIGGIQKSTLIDYPQKIASVVFTQGCNFRCGYCHNPELLSASKTYGITTTDEYIAFLKTRLGKLDGVVITGGEPTLQSGLYEFIYKIKNLGFSVKLDTNGTNPDILNKLIRNNLLDYIAMDIKAPLRKYTQITNVNVSIKDIKNSIKIIIKSNIEHEFRTTVIKSQISPEDIIEIGKIINGAQRYYLQKFIPSKILDINLLNEKTYTDQELQNICNNLKKYINNAEYR
ncbi:MAG: anaerobic ribonucleoside-triphosphate reductase activating protein [Candidatus Gastranaerophilaceae bacterium]|nr:anaerobic ribonucleoside-triphosphate reductase activating protein [Candidatus Gastranaerophilaceae bacterium]